MSRARVGFGMHPRWLGEGDASAFLEPLREQGLAALEFELDGQDPHWPHCPPLMATCRRLGFELCFHAPYRGAYNIAGFAGRERRRLEAVIGPLLEVAVGHAPAVIVVHGARSPSRPQPALREDTAAFLQWLLARYPGLRPALENLAPAAGVTKIGSDRASLLGIVAEIGDPRLGICWDVGHDLKAGQAGPPPGAWLAAVRHVHIHDLDERGVDHYPLLYGRVEPRSCLRPLIGAGYAGIVTLELKGEQLAHLWPERLPGVLAQSVRALAQAIGRAQDRP